VASRLDSVAVSTGPFGEGCVNNHTGTTSVLMTNVYEASGWALVAVPAGLPTGYRRGSSGYGSVAVALAPG